MEVTSSTGASTSQDGVDHTIPQTTPATDMSSSTSSAEADGMNNTVSADASTMSMEAVPVRYGPALPTAFYPSETISYSKDVPDSKAVHGSCGLYNLGNTCFMNAGLQSLMSCAPLVKFFCESYPHTESGRQLLTDSNVHTLTAQFYVLLCKIWSGRFSLLHPKKFKEVLGFHYSQFEDYRQHDCQEFLALLLDTLHEQLNKATDCSNCLYSPSLLPIDQTSSSVVVSDALGVGDTSTNIPAESPFPESQDKNNTGDLSEPASKNYLNNDSTFTTNKQVKTADPECAKKSMFLQVEQPVLSSEISSSPCYLIEGSPTSELSVSDCIVPSPSSNGDGVSHKSPDPKDEEDVITSSSFAPLRHFASRSNLDDVTSSDSGLLAKPSLKRVSSGNSVSASTAIFHSEDSNHSSVSAHSTDSEQSSAFKRLKIDAVELNRNANNNCKDCVTSSSDCKKTNRSKKNMLGNRSVLRETEDDLVTSDVAVSTSHKDLNVIVNMVSSCQDSISLDIQPVSPAKSEVQAPLSPALSCLDDFYSKETKTLNTNVLVSDFLQEITSDSEKFAKVDNRNRPPSKEINILQEAFGEEDKAEKILIGQRFGGLKDTNLYAHSAVTVVKPMKNTDPNILNNSLDRDPMTVEPLSKFQASSAETQEVEAVALKLLVDTHKLDEEEKNVQMQAYTKFNTVPTRSNIRTDLTDTVADPDGMEVDEAESSDEEEIEIATHTSTVEECSSVPNCLRHCAPSEVMMANRAWDEYVAKNDSVVVSTFQGQFRSTVVCSECSHVSVTYEPFMYLSLPIPHAMEQQMCVVYISQNKPPVRFLLNLLKTDKIGTAKKKLSELLEQEDCDIIMAEVLDSHISRILDDNILLKYVNLLNRKIYAFEMINMDCNKTQASDSVATNQLLNNEETPSPAQDVHFPTSSHVELNCAADSQVSNQSFDSINVNSPSSRDTLDYMFSDSEACESNIREGPEFPSHNFKIDDEDAECQSTSGMISCRNRSPWVHGKISGGGFACSFDEEDGINSSVSTNNTALLSSHPVKEVGEHINSFISGLESEPGEVGSAGLTQDSGNYSSASASQLCQNDNSEVNSSGNAYLKHGSNLSPTLSDRNQSVDGNDVGVILNGSLSNYSSVTTTTNIMASSTTSSHQHRADSEDNPSRSCPSPDRFSPLPEHQPSLMDVAARLKDSPGSYFLHRSQPDENYEFYQDGLKMFSDNPCTYLEEKTAETDKPNWTEFPLHSSSNAQNATTGGELNQWRTCAICLEDLLDTELLTHIMCDGVFCQNCLEMSVKHTADVSAFCCPICLQAANMCEDFVPLASTSGSKPKIRTLPISIAYRYKTGYEMGVDKLQLIGHPSILHMPSVISADTLYSQMDNFISPLMTTYSIMLTDGQGLTCSRCTYSCHCTGCEIAREGQITLQPSDCLTVQLMDDLSPDQVHAFQLVHEDASMAGLRSSEPTTIMDCFGAFTQSELLDEHNPWYCPQCERNQCAKKTMTVWRYPDNLIIHLKRFVYQDLSSTKVDTKVIFPHEGMDVRGFLSGPSSNGLVYDLYSIICHFGGANAGHYTCYAKHPLTSQWFYYNDESVSQQTPTETDYSSGYVLFYQRQGTDVDFTPPQNLPFLEDNFQETMPVPSSSSSSCAYVRGSNNNKSTESSSSSMAVVLYQLPSTSGQKTDRKEEEEEYVNEARCASLTEESLEVHFESQFPDPCTIGGGDRGQTALDEAGEGTHIAEPDSTHDFYS